MVPAALYGCGVGGDGAPLRSVGDVGTVAGVELGLGYAVAPAVRLEALLTSRPRFTFDGYANFLAGRPATPEGRVWLHAPPGAAGAVAPVKIVLSRKGIFARHRGHAGLNARRCRLGVSAAGVRHSLRVLVPCAGPAETDAHMPVFENPTQSTRFR